MIKLQNSIAGLLVFTVVIGIGAASLLNASRLWASVISMLTSLMLLAAILGVIYRTGENRASWTGFILFGWGFVLLSVCGGFSKDVVNPSEESRRFLRWLDLKKNLMPVIGEYSDIIDYRNSNKFVSVKILDLISPGNYNVQYEDGQKTSASITLFRNTNEEFYLAVGNSLCNLLVAFTGSMVGRYFHATRAEHT